MSKSTCCRNPCVTVYCTDLGTDHFKRCLQGWAFGCVLWWNDFCGNAESIHSLRGMVQIMPRSFHYSRRSWERAKKENSSGSRSAKAHVQMDSPISAGWTIRCHQGVGNERNLVHLVEKSVEIKLKSWEIKVDFLEIKLGNQPNPPAPPTFTTMTSFLREITGKSKRNQEISLPTPHSTHAHSEPSSEVRSSA